jgi:hypothetical protein
MNKLGAVRASHRELLIVGGLFLLVASCLYGPHVVEGGFTIDDWGHAASARYFRDEIFASYWAFTGHRPILAIYVPFTYIVFGSHEWIHLAWSILLAVAMSTALFALLRRLAIPALHASLIALLVLLFPWSDSIRFWGTAGHISLVIALGISGIVVALRGFEDRAGGRITREKALHACAVVLYAASVLTYEIAGIALLFAGALYLTRAPWPVVRVRWAIDAAVVTACLAWTAIKGDRVQSSLQEMLEHAKQLADGSITLLAQATVPFATVNRWVAAAILAAIVLVATIVWGLRPSNADVDSTLRRWLIAFWTGVVVAALGWVLYIPANPYYQNISPGVGNRTNGLAAIGVVIVIYSAIALLATLLTQRARRVSQMAAFLTVAFAVPLVIGYGHDIRSDQRAWADADKESDRMLSSIKTALPNPPPGSTIYSFDYPGSQVLGIVIFAYQWDLNGAIKLTYDNPTLSGYPILEGTTMRCARKGVEPTGEGWGSLYGAPYGKAFFVDATRVRARRIDSRAACQKSLDHFKPGPAVKSL